MKNKVKFLIIIILIVVAVTGIIYIPKSENVVLNNNVIENSEGVDVPEKKESSTNTNKNVAIIGMKNLNFMANSKNVNVNFKNPIENDGLYYQTFELRLLNDAQGSYEVLYKSDMVKPGEEITEITLSRDIEQGEYDAILYVQPYRMDAEKTPTNDAKIKVKIIVN